MNGDLQARLPERKTPDEIGRVSHDVNVMLDEIVRLVAQIQSVSDNIAHDLRGTISVVRAKLERAVADPDEKRARLAANQALVELDKAMVTIAALLRMAEIEHASQIAGLQADRSGGDMRRPLRVLRTRGPRQIDQP